MGAVTHALDWPIESVHPDYGKVQMMGILTGERYRWMIKDEVVSMIPLSMLGEYSEGWED